MFVRLSIGLLVALSLAGCVGSANQEFAVTGAAPAPAGTMFRTADANINDAQGKAYCAGGYDKLGESTVQSDAGPLTEWRLRCSNGFANYLPF